jgi:hypothetical protein
MDPHQAIVVPVEKAGCQQPIEQVVGLTLIEHDISQNLSVDRVFQNAIERAIQRPAPQRHQPSHHHEAALA